MFVVNQNKTKIILITNNILAVMLWFVHSYGSLHRFEKINALKNRNPGLKTLIAVGGWNAKSTEFTKMVSSMTSIRKFVQSSLTFIRRYGFDGLDLDWEYPGQRGGKPSDKRNLVKLVKVCVYA